MNFEGAEGVNKGVSLVLMDNFVSVRFVRIDRKKKTQLSEVFVRVKGVNNDINEDFLLRSILTIAMEQVILQH